MVGLPGSARAWSIRNYGPQGVEPRPQLGECQPADQVSDAYKQEEAERDQDIAFTAG
jgi:hypothetical protein